jgi:hypothetical protein
VSSRHPTPLASNPTPRDWEATESAFGHHATMESYLRALARTVGEEAQLPVPAAVT